MAAVPRAIAGAAFGGPRPRWRLSRVDETLAAALSKELGVPPIVGRLLAGRGMAEAEAARAFLSPKLSALHDPFLLKDMDRAVDRIRHALDTGERITVYGDYDVDGVTSTACLVSFLAGIGADVGAYIPRRLEEGYGLNLSAVETLAAEGTRLLVTCDCGVTAVDEVDRAVALGVDVVVIDHHRVPATLPRASAILNPYQPGCEFPFPHLAAVGVTFNLMLALRKRLRDDGFFGGGRGEPNLKAYLDLVALGTIADVVPLMDENRVLVTHGLEVLGERRRLGVRALCDVAGLGESPVTAGQVGFKLGPRINAAGRLADARAGLELLLSTSDAEARPLADALDRANTERREIEHEIVRSATQQAMETADGTRGLVLTGAGWHRGVVGIVASRMVERFHRPTLVLSLEDGVARGSGRSTRGFHLHEALTACASYLTRFGGHRAAAGLELRTGDLPAFREAFLAECARRLTDDDLVPVLDVDAEIRPEALDWELCSVLERLGPYGMGNPSPVLAARGVRLTGGRIVGQPRDGAPAHLKARLGSIDAIGFGLGDRIDLVADGEVDVAFTLGFNWWKGTARVQANLKGVWAAGAVEVREGDGRGAGAGESAGHVIV